MAAQIYHRIPHTAEAYKVTENNLAEVANWCGGEVVSSTAPSLLTYFGMGSKASGQSVLVATRDGYISVGPGEWLVKEKRDGLFFRMTQEEFQADYQSDIRVRFADARDIQR